MKNRPNPFLAGLLVSLAIATAATAAEASYRYFRFTPIKLRNDSTSNSIQISEFTFLYGGAPVSYAGATVSNPGGYTPTAEVAANVMDGNTATKWLDFGKSPLVFDFGASTTIDGYRFTTANDATERDPLRWILEGSGDGAAWTVLDYMTADFATPTARTTATSDIALPATPAPCVKNWTGGATLNWNSSDLNWNNGATVSWDNNSLDIARFNGAGGATVSLTEPVLVRSLDFTQSGYTVQGGSFLLTGITRFTASAPAQISSSIGGSVGIVKNGASTLTLSGANTFTGGNGQTGPVLVRDGTLVLTGSNAYTGRSMVIGGTLTFSGSGSKTGTGDAIIGNATGKGVLNIGGSSNVSFNGTPVAGNETNGVGAIRMTGGTASFSQDSQYLTLANGSNAYGTLELSGGTLTVPTFGGIRTGFNGTGILTQTGGTLNCGRWFAIAGGNSRGVATFTGGTATINGSYRILLADGATSNATLNIGTMAGGGATVTSSNGTGVTLLNSNTASAAVLNLNSGALVLGGPIYRNTGNTTGNAALNLNGGTLRASGSVNLITASATLPVYLFNKGVTVDSQGNNAAIPANLLAAAGNGIYPAGGVIAVPSDGGSGYYGAPAVTVSGGSGTGATAIANITDGVVTGVTLTSPGQGYLEGDNITFTFTGGGASTAALPFVYALTAGDVAANGGGGLVKTGSGTITLGGANTYSGPTSVRNGTLVLQGTNATTSVVLGDTSTAGKLQLGNATSASNLSLSSLVANAGGGSVVGGNGTTNSVLTLGVASGTQTITSLGGSGANENALSLVKNGPGTFVITGSTSHTGSTTLNEGTLQVPTGSFETGPCTVADGTTLAVTGDTFNSWKTTELSLGSTTGATLDILNFDVGATAPPISVSGNLETAGDITVNIHGLYEPGVYPLIFYPVGGSIGGDGIGAFQLGALPRGVIADIVDDNTNYAVALDIEAVNPLIWKGNVDSSWDINSTSNWTMAGSPDKYLEGDNLRFDNSATGDTHIALNTTVAPSNITFDNNASKPYTIGGSGGITGNTQLLKKGEGSLTLACDNTYTGGTKINEGTLSLGDGSSNGSVTGALVNSANLIFNPATTATFPGTLDGTGLSLVKTGGGTQVLTGDNTYNGAIQITGGTLQIGNGATNGTFGAMTNYEVAAGASLYLNYATAVSATTGTWSSRVTGAGTLSLNSAQPVNGSAAWGILSLSPTFTGVLHVRNGRVDCADNSSMGGTSKVQLLDGCQLLARNSVNPYTTPIEIAGLGWGESGYNQGALRIAGGHTATWAGDVTLTADAGIMCQSGGNFTITGSISGPYVCQFHSQNGGTLTLAPAAATPNTYGATRINGASDGVVVAGNAYALSAGPLEVTSSTLRLNGNSFAFASLSGTGGRIGNYHASAPAVLTVGGSGNTTYSGGILDGSTAKLDLVKNGTGTLALTGALTYTGDTTINAGVLSISSAGLDDSSTVTIAGGAVIDLPNAGSDTVGKLILGGTEVPGGTYGASHPIYGAYFTGAGTLVVEGGYDSWAEASGLTASNNGLADDPDNDGTDNLLEFYLNGNPLASDPSILPAQALDATYLTLNFSRRDDAEEDVGSQAVQYGSDLAGWTSVPIGAASSGPDANGVIVTVSENDADPDAISVQIPRALAPTGKLFGRLQVTK